MLFALFFNQPRGCCLFLCQLASIIIIGLNINANAVEYLSFIISEVLNLNWLQYTEMSTGKEVAVTIEGDANNVDSATPDEKTKEKGMNRA